MFLRTKGSIIWLVLFFATDLGVPGPVGAGPLPLDPLDQDDVAHATQASVEAPVGDLMGTHPPAELGVLLPSVEHHGQEVGSWPLAPVDPWAESPPDAAAPAQGPARAVLSGYGVEDNHHVRRFLDYFRTGYRRAVVERWLTHSGRYLPMIEQVFRQKGLPEDLVFTAMIESGFNPVAVSRAGAKGLWQFMAPTARRYGLRVDRWLDERLDPEKSTVAAANYLRDLYFLFGSWNLVQAAYNAGENKVTRAMQAMRTSDFWELAQGRHLANETKDFVPAIQAVTLIGREPERYGFFVTRDDPVRYEVVPVPPSTSFKRLATVSGISEQQLEWLNPELKFPTTPPGHSYSLKVPVGGAEKVRLGFQREAAAQLVAAGAKPGKLKGVGAVTREGHMAKPNGTRVGVAKHDRVSLSDVVRWSDLSRASRSFPGDRLSVAGGPSHEGQDGRGVRR